MSHLKLRDQQWQAIHTVFGEKIYVFCQLALAKVFVVKSSLSSLTILSKSDLVGSQNRCAIIVSPLISQFSYSSLLSTSA